VKVNGRWCWQARVAHGGARRSRLSETFEAARQAKGELPGPGGRPYSREQIGKMFRRAACAAGLKDFTFHDLRHHGATMVLNRGFTGPIVMALGGWKTERMMRRYAAVTDRTLRAAAEAVSRSEITATTGSGGHRWPRVVREPTTLIDQPEAWHWVAKAA
jgi:integrase